MKRIALVTTFAAALALWAQPVSATHASGQVDRCPGQSSVGHEILLLYVVPGDRGEVSRDTQFRTAIHYMDAALDYSTGPRYDQDFRWVCDDTDGNGVRDTVRIVKLPLALDVNRGTAGDNDNVISGYDIMNEIESIDQGNTALGEGEYQERLIWVEVGSNDHLVCSKTEPTADEGAGGCLPNDRDPTRGWYGFVRADTRNVMRNKAELHELVHLFAQVPDGICMRGTYDDCVIDVLGLDRITDDVDTDGDKKGDYAGEVYGHCGIVQIDCDKDDYYSAEAAAAGVNRFSTGQLNGASSPWLTPVTSTTQQPKCGGASTTAGTEGADVLGPGPAHISGLDRDDTLDGDSLLNILCGGDGDDTLFGRGGVDELYGNAGRDTIYGNAGDDAYFDGYGKDTIDGGTGTGDTLYACQDYVADVVTNVEFTYTSLSYCYNENFNPFDAILIP